MDQKTMTTKDSSIPEEVNPKIPLQRRWPPHDITLAVSEKHDGEWIRKEYSFSELPKAAQKAYLKFNGVPKEVKELDMLPSFIPGEPSDYPSFESSNSVVWMCKECAERDDKYEDRGYLTQQKACKATVHRTPTCSHTFTVEENNFRGFEGIEWGSEEAWSGEILINGGRSAPVDRERSRQLVVTEYPEWNYTAEPIDETTVNLPEKGTLELDGETNGKQWSAKITVNDTVEVEWERTLPSGKKLTGTLNTTINKKECNGTSFVKVYPESRARKENYLPLHEMEASDFPNHPSHFGRMVSTNSNRITGNEMQKQVCEAIQDFYDSRVK